MKNKEFIPLLSDFLITYLPEIKGVSKNTIASYQYAFRLLFEFMDEVKGIPPEKVSFTNLINGTVAELEPDVRHLFERGVQRAVLFQQAEQLCLVE